MAAPAAAASVPVDTIPQPTAPMTPGQRLSWLREHVNVSTLTSHAAALLDKSSPAEADDDDPLSDRPPTPRQRLKWLRHHLTSANLTSWIGNVSVASLAAQHSSMLSNVTARVGTALAHAKAWVVGLLGRGSGGGAGASEPGGDGVGASEHPLLGARAHGALAPLLKHLPQPWVAAWHSLRGRVEGWWVQAPRGAGWAIGALACLSCCCCCCCCLRACVRFQRRRNLHTTYTAVVPHDLESDPFIHADSDEDESLKSAP